MKYKDKLGSRYGVPVWGPGMGPGMNGTGTG